MPLAPDVRAFYTEDTPMTALPAGLEPTPGDVAGVFALVQGVVMHPFWAEAYGQRLTPEREAQTHTRSAADMLARVRELDPAPLAVARPPEREFTGNCRHHTVLATALLRRAGIPARVRCGFGRYFEPGKGVDHWVVEYWDETTGGWKLGDAQLDAVQQRALKLGFDPLDVPRTDFLVGGDAWRACRAGAAEPASFGILHMWGLWFIAGNLIRDIAALNGVPMLPWDVWGGMLQPDETPGEPALARLDRLAGISHDPDADFSRLRAAYADPDVAVPGEVFNAVTNRMDKL